MSGSDLDGDLYFVTWHEQFQLKENETPMDFPTADEIELDRPVTEADIIEQLKFVVESDNIGRLSNQHLVFADWKGIHSDECIRLAQLHSEMVDAPKSGVVPEWPIELRTKKAPDFLEKDGHRETYESKWILGKLHRHAKSTLEVIHDLTSQTKVSRKNDTNHCERAVQEWANMLLESYTSVMENLSETYRIREETKIWRVRFPNFGNTVEEQQDRRELIKVLSQLQQTIVKNHHRAVEELEKRGISQTESKRQLYNECKRLATRPFCAGLPLLLSGVEQKSMSNEDVNTRTYQKVGKRILSWLNPELCCLISDRIYLEMLVKQGNGHTIYFVLRYQWLLATAVFLVEQLCDAEDEGFDLWSKFDCVMRLLVDVSIGQQLCRPDDFVSAKSTVGLGTKMCIRFEINWLLQRRLKEQLRNFAPSMEQEVYNVGRLAVYSLWEIYNVQKTYEDWEKELKDSAISSLLKLAFRAKLDI